MARYFDTAIHVPPAVLRSVDKTGYLKRVAEPGQALSANSAALEMNHAGWVALTGAVRDPASHHPADELLASDRTWVCGALLRAHGERYGEALNGSRASGWGDGQGRDFQHTAPFIALGIDQPLAEAMAEGLRRGWQAQSIPAAAARSRWPTGCATWSTSCCWTTCCCSMTASATSTSRATG